MIENLIFGRSGSNKSVFEKHFISYSCIIFIKYYALRSFYIKLLCFSKIWFFQTFDRLNQFLDRSKLRLKFWFESAWFDRFSITVELIECNFQSIESNFRSIKNHSESFLKTEVFHVFIAIQTFSKSSLSLWSVKV